MNVISEKQTKARKEHTCLLCNRKIKINEMYTVFVIGEFMRNGKKTVFRFGECRVCTLMHIMHKTNRLNKLEEKQNGTTN